MCERHPALIRFRRLATVTSLADVQILFKHESVICSNFSQNPVIFWLFLREGEYLPFFVLLSRRFDATPATGPLDTDDSEHGV